MSLHLCPTTVSAPHPPREVKRVWCYPPWLVSHHFVGLWGRCYPLDLCELYSLNCNGFSICVRRKKKVKYERLLYLPPPRPQHIGTLQFHRACVLQDTFVVAPPLPFKKCHCIFLPPPAPNKTLGTLQFQSHGYLPPLPAPLVSKTLRSLRR
jgi:hypothetical protein